MRKLYLLAVLIPSMFVLNGCSFFDSWVYRPDINQGNFITQNSIDQLQVGLSKQQVLYLMGTPMLDSVYENDVWYYIFRELPTHGKLSQKTYVLTFNPQGALIDVQYSALGKAATLQKMDKEGE